MKKIYLSIILWDCSIIVTYAQSVYMHEAYQDAKESGATGFSGIFSVLVFFGLVYLISKIWPSKNKNSSNTSNSTYDTGIDDDIRWNEDTQEKAEMEVFDHLKDIEDNDYYFNSYDYSIKKESSKATDEVPQKPKYHPSTGDVFFNKIICEQEEKYYPVGSIKDRLQNLTKERFVDLGLP